MELKKHTIILGAIAAVGLTAIGAIYTTSVFYHLMENSTTMNAILAAFFGVFMEVAKVVFLGLAAYYIYQKRFFVALIMAILVVGLVGMSMLTTALHHIDSKTEGQNDWVIISQISTIERSIAAIDEQIEGINEAIAENVKTADSYRSSNYITRANEVLAQNRPYNEEKADLLEDKEEHFAEISSLQGSMGNITDIEKMIIWGAALGLDIVAMMLWLFTFDRYSRGDISRQRATKISGPDQSTKTEQEAEVNKGEAEPTIDIPSVEMPEGEPEGGPERALEADVDPEAHDQVERNKAPRKPKMLSDEQIERFGRKNVVPLSAVSSEPQVRDRDPASNDITLSKETVSERSQDEATREPKAAPSREELVGVYLAIVSGEIRPTKDQVRSYRRVKAETALKDLHDLVGDGLLVKKGRRFALP